MKSLLNKYKVLAILVVLVPTFTNAQPPSYPRPITLTVTAPDSFVDGTPITAEDVITVEALCQDQNGTVLLNREVFGVPFWVPGGRDSYTFVDAVPGPSTVTCVVYAVVYQISSDQSNQVSRRYTGQPSPPTNLVFE